MNELAFTAHHREIQTDYIKFKNSCADADAEGVEIHYHKAAHIYLMTGLYIPVKLINAC